MIGLIIGIVEAVAFVGVLFFLSKGAGSAANKSTGRIKKQIKLKSDFRSEIRSLYDRMIDLGTLREKAEEYKSFLEALKAEKGRITITQAELETVESRLRELEEIERELEASGIETKEELNILTKKREDIHQKNSKLNTDINDSLSKMDEVLGELELNAQVQEQVDTMKANLVQLQERIDHILERLETGHEQYYIMKKRYDALDIEYAQLYEKFSAAEMSISGGSSEE